MAAAVVEGPVPGAALAALAGFILVVVEEVPGMAALAVVVAVVVMEMVVVMMVNTMYKENF